MAITDRLSALTPEQRALFEKLREQQKKQKAPVRAPQPPPIPRRGEGAWWPLSFDQERLWFLYMLNPEDTSYNIDTASRIRGRLDHAALEGAFQEIPRRHEIWRTAFPAVDGRPVQVVLPEMRLPSAIVDLRALPQELREPTAYRWMAETTRVPFPMATGPLAKATLFRLDDEDCIVQLVVHHIVTDWVTFQLFWHEIGLLYEAYVAGEPSPLPEPAVQYADYTAWQREWMSGEVEQYFLRYWVEHLKDAPLALSVPTDRPRPPVMTSHGDRTPVRVERAAELKALARREGLTPFMAMLAAYQIVLGRWSGADRVIVGSPNANRNRIEIQEIFGFFLTQLPFCTDVSGDPTLREALRRTRDVALAAYAHQDLPFGKLVEALQPERDLSRAPIIQVVLLLLDGSVLTQKLADLELAPVDVHDGNARYDVMFATWDHPDLIHGWYEYNSDLWDKPTAARLVEAFDLAIEAMLADPERPLSEVPWVSPAAAHQVLAEWNDTDASYPTGPTLHGLIAAQAERTPRAIAATFEGGSLTYAELQDRARRLARHLTGLGVTPDARVGVRMERSLDLIVALLGILEAGAAYVPLDPSWPEERLRLVLESARPAAVLEKVDPTDRTDPSDVFDPELTAYVIFTSGSTGTPKGVAVPHRGIVNRLLWMQATYGLTPEDRVLQKTPFGFDVSVWEFFWPLLAGARLVFARPEGHKDARYLAELIAREGITTLHFVPSMLQVFLETLEAGGAPAFPRLRRVMASGEALPPEMVRRFHALLPGVELHNLYGPTEASVDVSFWPVEPSPARVPIGRPIANLRLHVADRNLRPQPIGVPGELLIGGIGLARGYLRRPELTAAAFVPDPFGGEAGGRLYRTGDLVRTLADGNIEFLGRIDHQVKIRGVRIELGEVEAVLGRHPSVGECVAVARDGDLVAYVTGPSPEPALAPDDLRRWLLERLPEAMVPSTFVVLDALPLSANGKVDRRALPAPERSREAAGAAYVAPRSPEEELLAGLWEKVLGIERPGVHDHFFSLGGHSLLATRLTLYIRDAFAVDLPVRAIFQAPTIAAQAELIASLQQSGATVESGRIQRLPREAWPLRAPLSFAQERLWFLDRLMPGSPAYNLAVALRLDGPLDAAALADAFHRLVERHEALRTALPEREGRPVQEVAAAGSVSLQEIDLSGSASPEADARRLAEADALRPFDLAAGPLLRATLLALAPERHVLLLAMHHIVSDAWSMGVLVDDLTALYAGRPRPELPVQYADYAVWQRERLTGEEVARQLAFWRDQLAGAPPFLDLPTDRPRPAVQSLRGGMLPVDLDIATTAALANLAQKRNATLYMVLLAGWGALLGRLADQRDLVLGTAVANRDRPEVEGLIGFFVNTLAMRVDLEGAPSFEDLLGRLRHRVLDAFSHRDLPFEKLVEELHPARDRSRQPIFQIMLTFQNVPMGRADLAGLTLTPLEVEGQTTKFDLTLTLFEEGGRVVGRLEYASDLFDRATAERWIGGFGRLLTGAAAAPGTRVAELPLASPEELRQVLAAPNQTAAAYPRDASLGDLFAEQAARHPSAVAVVAEGDEVSWEELERRSACIARRLRGLGAGLESRVGLVAGRTPGLIAGLLGIVRAGGANVPLDTILPPVRLAWMLADSGARLLLAERRFLDGLPSAALPPGVRILALDEAEAEGAPEAPLPSVPAEALAYVMYTSGSTGTPKGVAVTHRNVIRLVRGSDYADLGPEQVWLQAAPVSFDASTLEIWAPLLNGGRLVLMPPGRAALDDVAAAIARFGVTSLWLTAGLFHQMVEYQLDGLRPLRQLLAGGDAVAPEAARRVLESLPDLALIDGYGPTEGTTFTCCHRVTGNETGTAVPIGRPIANARVYVLDSEEGALQPVPPGVAGELYAGGDGLARGYLDRPELTAERFVPDPFSGLPGERLYRTGDRVRWVQDTLEFLGRLDNQVKIRGFRVEPGEVEAALAGHPAVRQAAVLPRDGQGGRLLAAYAALSEPASAADLQRFLRERLPEAMVPSAWIFLEELPLTPNGKVDRRALAGLEVEAARTAVEHVPPRTPLEERLVEAVAGVLGLDPARVGVYDNFFDLGGHSLLATQLAAQLRQQHGIEISLPLLFDSAHLADLADQITARELEEADEALLEEILAELEGSE
jgi:amino acid adenylation domain-containing protein